MQVNCEWDGLLCPLLIVFAHTLYISIFMKILTLSKVGFVHAN